MEGEITQLRGTTHANTEPAMKKLKDTIQEVYTRVGVKVSCTCFLFVFSSRDSLGWCQVTEALQQKLGEATKHTESKLNRKAEAWQVNG